MEKKSEDEKEYKQDCENKIEERKKTQKGKEHGMEKEERKSGNEKVTKEIQSLHKWKMSGIDLYNKTIFI